MERLILWLGIFLISHVCTVAAEPKDARGEIFGLDKLHEFHLTVSAKDYAAMDPPQPAGFGGRPGAAPARPVLNPADAGAGNFGFEFEYVHADLEVEGKTYKDVGLRYKGSGTYMMSQRQAKRSFKIDLDRYGGEATFHEHKKLNLNSGVMDPTKAREVLAYEVFRAAGVPAPRTALAIVTLTVPGKFEREMLGVYTLVEQVDKPFLKTHFGDNSGLLLKPEGIRGVPNLGDEVASYEKLYNLKSDAKTADWKRLIEFTRLVNKADDAEFRGQIAEKFDIDAFTRFLAANTLLSSMDGFIGVGHNYYLYLSPKTNKFAFIPWDLDLAFGAFPMYGNTQQLADLSIEHPHVGENKLIDRLLAMPDVKTAYREQLRKLIAELFNADKLGRGLSAVETLLKEPLAQDKAAATNRKEQGGGMGMFGGGTMPLQAFITQRVTSVNSQLDGKSKGYMPTQGFGFGGPPPGAGQQLAKPLLDALDADKDGKVSEAEFTVGMKRLSGEWDQDKNGALDQKEIADGLQKLLPRRPM
ncbi:CotH kinase family protein [Anatilimnocola floriformis]|uniref:CotH kinase family protein n=1 Tax=Anatilimnocola floriformis TaxID=2948575 RepID=UPI0020C31B00|nr:CotH kinase family protein [Anatilimnocola floriformis]